MFSLTVLFISANFIKKIYTFWSTCISFVYRCIFLWKIPTTYMQVTQVFLSQDDCLFCFNGFFFLFKLPMLFSKNRKNTLHHALSCVVFMLNFFCCESNFALTMQSYHWLLEGVENLAHCWLYAVTLLSEYGGETSRAWTGTRQQNPVWNSNQVLALLGLAKQVS